MHKYIAGLDVGSSSIKLIVGEIIKNKINVLACLDTPSRGIKKGYVINTESAKEAFNELFKKAEVVLGIPLKKVVVGIPSLYTSCFLETATLSITSEDKVITKKDIKKLFNKCIKDKIVDSQELVAIEPTGYKVNDEVVVNPIGMTSEKIIMKAILVTVPKKNSAGIRSALNSIGVEVEDVVISPIADYFEFKNKDTDKAIGAIVNLGDDITTISIINKGNLTNTEVIDIGGKSLCNDLMYVYKIGREDALYLKNNLALAHTRLAQPNESLTFTDKHGESIKINQYDASEIIMARLTEILNLAKKQINLLTKKEISYIIITGGLAEIQDFDILVEEIIGNNAIIGNPLDIGARSNVYSTAMGIIKYYDYKLKLTDEQISIFDEDDIEEFVGKGKRLNISDNSILGKLFGYFFDN